VVLQDAATGAAAVDLVNAEMGADVEFAPDLGEEGASCFLSEERFQRGAFVLDVGDGLRRFDLLIVQTATTNQSSRGQFLPRYCDNADADARIEASRSVLSRMGAQRDPDRFAAANSDGNPEVIDVTRNPVGFRGKRDRHARDMNKVSMSERKVSMLAAVAVSMRQASRVIVYSAAWEEPVPIFLYLYLYLFRRSLSR
jgi:hypothetical protein